MHAIASPCEATVPSHVNKFLLLFPFLPRNTYAVTQVRRHPKCVDFMEGYKGLEINNSPFNLSVELCSTAHPHPPSVSTPSSSTQLSLQFLKWISGCARPKSVTYSLEGTGADQEYTSQAVLYWEIFVCLFKQLLQFPWKLTCRKALIWKRKIKKKN